MTRACYQGLLGLGRVAKHNIIHTVAGVLVVFQNVDHHRALMNGLCLVQDEVTHYK